MSALDKGPRFGHAAIVATSAVSSSEKVVVSTSIVRAVDASDCGALPDLSE
jgi:hypothetical protein